MPGMHMESTGSDALPLLAVEPDVSADPLLVNNETNSFNHEHSSDVPILGSSSGSIFEDDHAISLSVRSRSESSSKEIRSGVPKKKKIYRKLRANDARLVIRKALNKSSGYVRPALIPRVLNAVDLRRCLGLYLLNTRNSLDTSAIARYVDAFCHRDCKFVGPGGLVVQGVDLVRKAMILSIESEPADMVARPSQSTLLQRLDGTSRATITAVVTGTTVLIPQTRGMYPPSLNNNKHVIEISNQSVKGQKLTRQDVQNADVFAKHVFRTPYRGGVGGGGSNDAAAAGNSGLAGKIGLSSDIASEIESQSEEDRGGKESPPGFHSIAGTPSPTAFIEAVHKTWLDFVSTKNHSSSISSNSNSDEKLAKAKPRSGDVEQTNLPNCSSPSDYQQSSCESVGSLTSSAAAEGRSYNAMVCTFLGGVIFELDRDHKIVELSLQTPQLVRVRPIVVALP